MAFLVTDLLLVYAFIVFQTPKKPHKYRRKIIMKHLYMMLKLACFLDFLPLVTDSLLV
nr:MAG TPA: hypothetical protein [Caudoviricetes sp.]